MFQFENKPSSKAKRKMKIKLKLLKIKLLAPEEGLFSNRYIGQFVQIYIPGFLKTGLLKNTVSRTDW